MEIFYGTIDEISRDTLYNAHVHALNTRDVILFLQDAVLETRAGNDDDEV